jgi:TusA-related sulfurtransferase
VAGSDRIIDEQTTASENQIPKSDVRVDATGTPVSDLTALIDARLSALEIGGVLEVLTDDPAAETALSEWVAASGNELVARAEDGGGRARFYLLRRDSPTPQRDPYS